MWVKKDRKGLSFYRSLNLRQRAADQWQRRIAHNLSARAPWSIGAPTWYELPTHLYIRHHNSQELSAQPRKLRIGMVCPYSFDEPGGVQVHAIDLCTELQRRGHYVSLIGPCGEDTEVPDFLVRGGGSIPIPYNGSVARLSFGPHAWKELRAWLEKGDFDVVHVHEPNSPSYSLMTLMAWDGPLVATYHAFAQSSWLLKVCTPFLRPYLERISGGIAVSEMARRWQVEMLARDPILIPNGVNTAAYAQAEPFPHWSNRDAEDRQDRQDYRILFLGRFEESRKGLNILLDAWQWVVEKYPKVELLIAGSGDRALLASTLEKYGFRVIDSPLSNSSFEERSSDKNSEVIEAPVARILGRVSEEEKMSALASSDIYVAPNTGGESFGIVLVEAMSAGAAVVASDLPAFRDVSDNGQAARHFSNGDSRDLARILLEVLDDDEQRRLLQERGRCRAAAYDWDTITTAVERVYAAVTEADYRRDEGQV